MKISVAEKAINKNSKNKGYIAKIHVIESSYFKCIKCRATTPALTEAIRRAIGTFNAPKSNSAA